MTTPIPALFPTLLRICLTSLLLIPPAIAEDREIPTAPLIAVGAGKADVGLTRGGEDYLRLSTAVGGPNWGWAGVEGSTRAENGVTIAGRRQVARL